MDGGTILRVEDLGCERGGRLLFEGLDFTLRAGEALAVRGPNGSGKTTLLRALAGFFDPALGRIVMGSGEGREDRLQVSAYLGHLDGLKPALTSRETVRFWSGLYGARVDVPNILDRVRLSDRQHLPARVLSAGQRRRLALARLLVACRPIWILDEPSASLDAPSTALLEGMIAEHRAGGGIAVIALHGDLDLGGALTCRIGGEAP